MGIVEIAGGGSYVCLLLTKVEGKADKKAESGEKIAIIYQ